MAVILFIIILLVLILVHELGHYIVAKRSGIRVDEFGFGYPPRAKKLFTRKGTLFTLNWLPFGGFVKIFGEDPNAAELNGPDQEKSFAHKPRYIQALVLVAGVAMNFLFAWILFTGTYLFLGFPTSVGSEPTGSVVQNAALTITNVNPKSPAAHAGLMPGDSIAGISSASDRLDSVTTDDLITYIRNHVNVPLTLNYMHVGVAKSTTLTPIEGSIPGKGVIGISMDMIGVVKLPIYRAPIEAMKVAVRDSKMIVSDFYWIIHGSPKGSAHPSLSDVSGPVGIVGAVRGAYQSGLNYLIVFIGLISLNLAVINLIPFPALDGGRLLFVGIEAITRKKIPQKFFNYANLIGFGLLILLMLVVTYHDIVRLVGH